MALKLENVGDVLATRTLVLERDDELQGAATVLLGRPRAHGEEFYCPYQIKGAGDKKVGTRLASMRCRRFNLPFQFSEFNLRF